MRQTSLIAFAGALFVSLFVLLNAAFIVPESKSAIVLRFGEPTGKHTTAGLKFKTPFIENVEFIDKRNLELDQDEIEIIARNQERLRVDAFARYRIVDPVLFYQSVRTVAGGEQRMSTQMNQTVRRVLGEVSVDEIVSGKRSALMVRIRELLDASARQLGVEIIDVKIRRADLPLQNSQAVFQRMITERNQLAQQIRAEGNEESQKIMAQADREVVEIKSKAQEESEKLRGAADAERNAVFAAAYGKDPEFFAFYRSLIAYEEALKKGDSTILLSPDSEFLRYLNNVRGRR
ncbi:MAG TPA: protease modulator HflC [Parvularculaceae bacterium]|nr:protease modulator HflC [Parvularculaceae bacterium]HNS86394.1 protease modulator HflC [Parvularculaceae bacterium]